MFFLFKIILECFGREDGSVFTTILLWLTFAL